MLKTPKTGRDRMGALGEQLAKLVGTGESDQVIAEGLVKTGHWSPERCFTGLFERYPQLPPVDQEDFSCYGVCDSPEQFMEKHGKILEQDRRVFCVYFVEIAKKNNPPEGGWRWHKWGPYIGKQQPICEYIYDEPIIESVYTYHVYELLVIWDEPNSEVCTYDVYGDCSPDSA
jgi:hypothetical protein